MNILVCLEQKNNQLTVSSWQSLAVAFSISNQVSCLVFGSEKDKSLNHLGLQKIYQAKNLQNYHPQAYQKALSLVVDQQQPDLVLGQATTLGLDLFPRIAIEKKGSVLTDLIELTIENSLVVGGVKPLYAGKILSKVRFSGTGIKFIALRPNAFGHLSKPTSSDVAAQEIFLDVDSKEFKSIEIKEIKTQGESSKIELTEARKIISGGRALGSEANFEILFQCAKALGAAVGASRAAVDSGYAKHDMQVGQTGKTVSPDLYIACGISGAIQHMAGMRTSKVIVAINTDPQASIFAVSDYGIVGDLFQIVPILSEKLKESL